MGPVDFLVVEFPGTRLTGEGFPLLIDLVDRGIIRILDLLFVAKRPDGSVVGVELSELDPDGALGLTAFEGASSGGDRRDPTEGGDMPGLIRGVARTAVIAGTATAVSNRVSRRQAGRWAAQDQRAYAQEAPIGAGPGGGPDADDSTQRKIDQLRQLAELRTEGVLTEAEFEAEKARILGAGTASG